jgi:hypothetical protein
MNPIAYARITCPDGADCTNPNHLHAPDDPEGNVWGLVKDPEPDRERYPLRWLAWDYRRVRRMTDE